VQDLQKSAENFSKNIQMTEITIEHLTKKTRDIKIRLYKAIFM